MLPVGVGKLTMGKLKASRLAKIDVDIQCLSILVQSSRKGLMNHQKNLVLTPVLSDRYHASPSTSDNYFEAKPINQSINQSSIYRQQFLFDCNTPNFVCILSLPIHSYSYEY